MAAYQTDQMVHLLGSGRSPAPGGNPLRDGWPGVHSASSIPSAWSGFYPLVKLNQNALPLFLVMFKGDM